MSDGPLDNLDPDPVKNRQMNKYNRMVTNKAPPKRLQKQYTKITGDTGPDPLIKAETNIAKKMRENNARKMKPPRAKAWVEGGTDETPTRTGPYYKKVKATARQKSDLKIWRQNGRVGKKPELTGQPALYTPNSLTTATHRVSPRTQTMSRKATKPGEKQL